jgi:hypothetical protein
VLIVHEIQEASIVKLLITAKLPPSLSSGLSPCLFCRRDKQCVQRDSNCPFAYILICVQTKVYVNVRIVSCKIILCIMPTSVLYPVVDAFTVRKIKVLVCKT